MERRKSAGEKKTELNRKKIIFGSALFLFVLWAHHLLCRRSFPKLMVFNSSKSKTNAREKKGDPIFEANESTQYANTFVHFAYFFFAHTLFMHIIIAVNHSFSSPCQQNCFSLSLSTSRFVCACAYFHRKDKRRWIKKPKKDKNWMG